MQQGNHFSAPSKKVVDAIRTGDLLALESWLACLPAETQARARAYLPQLQNPLTKQAAIDALLRILQYAQPTAQARRILFLASNPAGTTPLQLDAEYARLSRELEQARGKLALESCFAAGADDLMRAGLDRKPRIIHFAGHGTTEGILLQNDDKNGYDLVTSEALGALFALFVRHFELEAVVLNACYSQAQAEAIAAHVPFVVGTAMKVKDTHAIAFSTGFYLALARSMPFAEAFEAGKTLAIVKGAPSDCFVMA
jgi:hypothetical protein